MTTRVGAPAFEAPAPEPEPDPVIELEPEPEFAPVLGPEPGPVPLALDDRMANGSAETTVLAAKAADAPPIDETTEAEADAAAASEEDEDDAVDDEDDDDDDEDAEAGEYGNTVDDDCIDGVSNVTLTALAHDCTLDLSDSDAAADTATN
jgi:hypothetical protein